MFCLLENAVANLVVKFPANYSFFDEFLFSFIAGTSCSLIVPEQVKWMNEPSIEAGLYYEVSIVNDIAVISKRGVRK